MLMLRLRLMLMLMLMLMLFITHHQWSSVIISLYQSSSLIISDHQWSSTIISDHHSSPVISHHQSNYMHAWQVGQLMLLLPIPISLSLSLSLSLSACACVHVGSTEAASHEADCEARQVWALARKQHFGRLAGTGNDGHGNIRRKACNKMCDGLHGAGIYLTAKIWTCTCGFFLLPTSLFCLSQDLKMQFWLSLLLVTHS